MLSIIVPVRNTRNYAANCLRSIQDTLKRLGLEQGSEVILMDDDSAPSEGIGELFRTFKQTSGLKVTALRFKKRQHYSRGVAVGMSLCRGQAVLLVSHDMVVTPPYVRTLLALSALDERYGIVRGTSPHVDMFPQHQVSPPMQPRTYEDIVAFSEHIELSHGLLSVVDRQICGDSFLIARRVIDKIGVMDGRYVAMFGDIDLGLRAQRAGFYLMCAKGAWLHHVGSGALRDDTRRGMDPASRVSVEVQVTLDSYQQFRQKWDPNLPQDYPGLPNIDLAGLRDRGPLDRSDFQPKLELGRDEFEIF